MHAKNNHKTQCGWTRICCALVILSPLAASAEATDRARQMNTEAGGRAPSQSEEMVEHRESQSGLSWSALADRGPLHNGSLLERLAPEETGLDVSYPIDTGHAMKRLYVSGFASGGVAVGDIDGDGQPDIFFVGTSEPNRLFRQTGSFRFEEITDIAGINVDVAWGSAAAMIDIDGDADLDIYLTRYDAANQLFINDGKGVFSEQAARFGLDIIDASLAPAFADYDRDGDLDLFLLTNRFYRDGGFPVTPFATETPGDTPRLLPQYARFFQLESRGPQSVGLNVVPRRDRLLRNDSTPAGGITFTDVSRQAGITEVGHGLSATWWDYNDDGFPDLYVANDYDDPDHLYHNHGDGRFSDVIDKVLPHTPWFSMGADVADVDGDGRLDLMVADMSGTNHFRAKTTMGAMNNRRILSVAGPPPQVMRNALYLNSGMERFREGAYLAGIADSDWSWAVKFGDIDCDGLVDLMITNGMTRNFNNSDIRFSKKLLRGRSEWDLYEATPTRPEKNLAFRNRGDLEFEPAGASWGLDDESMSFAAAWADFDGDGDLDPVVINMDQPVSVYRNNGTTGHRLVIRLHARGTNSLGIGAKVTAYTANGRQIRTLQPMTGFKSSNEPVIHFGLGTESTVERLEVEWPSGRYQVFEQLAADRRYTITEPEQSPPRAKPQISPLFSKVILKSLLHRETPFDDFKRQPLLPNKLSQLGPGMAWGDVDGDGDDDLYFGAAAGHTGRLWINGGGGRFRPVALAGDTEGRKHEDMGAVFFDMDSDGDLDLYVVSGGVESDEGSKHLRDRLYLNDGKGNLSKGTDSHLPGVADSGSVVVAGDLDGDGDLDLFIGSRVIPGKYPLSPASRLLLNDGKKLIDMTDQLAPGLQKTGLVTGALWSDADGDGRLDLLITHEWGPVKLFHNEGGRLIERTSEAGLAARTGWFNGITGGDVDHDGDIDYVVTNVGLNTKYDASFENPATLYYGDFEGDGTKRIIEAEYENKTLFPVRGKSCSTNAMPHLAKKFSTYRDFALADMAEIYTPLLLREAAQYKANTLESGILINDGQAHFTFQPLPRVAQISPAFGVALTEIDGDGHPDIYLVQNFFNPQLETGRMDGGVSQLLLGRGDGSFIPVNPGSSGLVVTEDAKSLATTDLDANGKPDFLVGINDDRAAVLVNRSAGNGKWLAVRLEGRPGNPTAVGARVKLLSKSGLDQTAEVYAGDGYLTQSSHVLYFGIGKDVQADGIEVVWPDGDRSSHAVPTVASSVTLRQQSAPEPPQ